MKNRKLRIAAVIFAALLALPLAAAAKQGMGGMDGKKGMGGGKGFGGGGDIPIEMLIHDGRIADELGLTSEQQEKLAKLFMASRKADIRTKADLQILKLDLMDLLDQDNPNVKQIDNKLEEMSKLETTLAKSKIHLLLDGKKILTDEQVEKVKSLLREKMQNRGGERNFKNRMGGPGGGPGEGFGGPGGPPHDEDMPHEFNSPFPSPDEMEP